MTDWANTCLSGCADCTSVRFRASLAAHRSAWRWAKTKFDK